MGIRNLELNQLLLFSLNRNELKIFKDVLQIKKEIVRLLRRQISLKYKNVEPNLELNQNETSRYYLLKIRS